MASTLSVPALGEIDLSVDEDIPLGWSADLRSIYPPDVPGRAHLRAMPTLIPISALRHVREKPPTENRLVEVQRRNHLISQAIQAPTLVYAPDRYTMEHGFYRQACAARDKYNPHCWLLVVLSLARLAGRNSEYHQAVTLIPKSTDNFYRANGILISRWIEAA